MRRVVRSLFFLSATRLIVERRVFAGMLMHLLPAPLREEPAKAEAGAETAAAPDGAHASAAQGRHPAQKRKKGFKVTVAGTDDDGD